MDAEFADLVPLFLGEARGRIEHLAELASRLEAEPAALADVRRELHTLKGAGRMLRLAGLADLCHAAEGALQAPRAGAGALLTRVVDALAGMVDAVAAGLTPEADADVLAALGGEPAAGAPAAPPAEPAGGAPPPAHPAAGEIRLDVATVDSLADHATRLRILALAAARFPHRLHELAHLAEAGTHEAQPVQALAVLAASLRRLGLELETGQARLQRLTEGQLETILALQVQPLRGLFVSLARHARELARSLGREVEVVTLGDETRLDRRIVRDLEEALIHLLRNAVDHGVEPPATRLAAGKPRAGTIRISALASGHRVRLAISDDGAGIDPAAVVARAVERGLLDETSARALSREDALRLLLAPGFSTRTEVSEISGRGLGLDVVAATVARLGGGIDIETRPGHGATITVELPAALRGEAVLVVRAGGLRLALPASVVRRVRRLRRDEVVERGGRVLAREADRLIPFVPLAEAFAEAPAASQLLIEGTANGRPLAASVDAIEGEEEVLVRRLPGLAVTSPLVEGVALLASGEPVAVLSPLALARRETPRTPRRAAPAASLRKLRVLLVDDSLVTREMERRLLEDAGFEVVTAGDAGEALTGLAEGRFECVVTDIEMPGMDGLELTRRLRSLPQVAHLPVVVVSTRDRPEDRLRGLEAGADAYLTKQGLDASELVAVVRRLGGR